MKLLIWLCFPVFSHSLRLRTKYFYLHCSQTSSINILPSGDQVVYPHKTTDKITVKTPKCTAASILRISSALHFFVNVILICSIYSFRPQIYFLLYFLCKILVLHGGELLTRNPTPHARGPPLLGSPQLLIQHICCYPSHSEAVSSIRNLRMRQADATRAQLWRTIN